MKEKEIIFTAKVLSVLFTPFYLPILGLLILSSSVTSACCP